MPDEQPQFELPSGEELAALLPSYSEISFLAQGGMAAVYRAVQTSLDRPVAIKVLPREFGQDEAFRLRFVAEAKTMAKLNHPNLVGIFDFGEIDGLLYLVMEFVEGQSLYYYAYGRTLDEVEAVEMTLAIAEGLAHAHEANVLHRDIKPANILLNEKNEPKLGDFGLANAGEREEGDELVFGTPGYTSPEVMAAPETADERADVFALGVLLHELLVGELPREPYQTPSRLAGCDPRVDAVVRKAISPNPALRHPSATSLSAELKQLLNQLKTAGRRKLATAATAKAAPATTIPVARPVLAAAPAPARKVVTPPAPDPTSDAPPPPRPSTLARPSHDWHLYRNLVIIAVLAAAIWGGLKVMKNKQNSVDEQNAAVLKEQERRAARDAAERAAASQAAQGNPTGTASLPTPTPTPTPEDPTPVAVDDGLTPREQLEKYQPLLARGERDKFPDGCETRGGSRFFFIEDEMNWHEAIRFAESYGAHLPVLRKDSDLRWLGTKMPVGDEMWLGAGATSRDDWAWFDETPFEHRKPSISLGTAAILTDIGILKAARPSKKLPFFLQWDEEPGTATREAMLARYVETKDERVPSWPAGVVCHEDRRFYVMAGPISQSRAAAIAASAGGHLAVASDELEAAFLSDEYKDAGLEELWLGAINKDGEWSWLTGESWSFARWAENEPAEDESATALAIGSDGWLAVNPTTELDGFIIEWSDDQKNATSAPVTPDAEPSASLEGLRTTAKNILAKNQQEMQKRMKDNSNAMGMSLRQWLRNIPRQEGQLYDAAVQIYIGAIGGDGRMPHPADVEMRKLPKEGDEIIGDYFARQKSMDEELTGAADKLRTAYVDKLEGLIAEHREKGLSAKVKQVESEITAVGESGREFLEYLGLISKDDRSLDPIVGSWEVVGEATKDTWTFSSNGGVLSSSGLKGKWRKTDDGYNLEWETNQGVNFEEIKGDTLTGINKNGVRRTFERAS